jgi:hypothetical protein
MTRSTWAVACTARSRPGNETTHDETNPRLVSL